MKFFSYSRIYSRLLLCRMSISQNMRNVKPNWNNYHSNKTRYLKLLSVSLEFQQNVRLLWLYNILYFLLLVYKNKFYITFILNTKIVLKLTSCIKYLHEYVFLILNQLMHSNILIHLNSKLWLKPYFLKKYSR